MTAGRHNVSEVRRSLTSRRTKEGCVHGRCKSLLANASGCTMATLDSLVIPAAFARRDKIVDTTVLADLDAWKSDTELSLNRLDSLGVSALSIFELADHVRVLAPLTAVAHWSSPAIRPLASGTPLRLSGLALTDLYCSLPCQNSGFGSTHHPHPDPDCETSLCSNTSSAASHIHGANSASSSRCTGYIY